MKILIVDDKEIDRESLAELISSYGYDVLVASNAREAMGIIQENPEIDLVLLDIVMPDMDGLDFLREIKQHSPEIDVIIITAYATLERAVMSIKEGAYDFLMKPFPNNEIFLSIERVKEKRRLEKERRDFRSRLEKALREWRLTFDSMHDAVMLLDNGFNILRANVSFSKLTGVLIKDVEGRKCYKLIHNTERPPSWCPLSKGVSKGGEISTQFYEPYLGRYLHVSLSPVYDNGKLTHYIHTIRDITKEKELEKAVKNTKETLFAAHEYSPYPIIIISPDYRIKYVNPALEQFTILRKEDLQGRFCFQALMCREEACEGCPLKKVIKEKSIFTKEKRAYCGNREVIFEQTIYPLFDERGEIEAVAEVIKDITDLRIAEKNLKESRDFLQSVLEGIGDAVIVIDRELRILLANSGYLKQTKRELKDVLGRHCYELSHGYNRPCPDEGEDCPVIKTLNDGKQHSSLHIHTASDGKKIYVEVNSYPLKEEAGKVCAAVETLTDVTEKVNLRRSLEESERKYRELYNSAPDLMHSLDEDGYIIECNDTEVKVLGYSRRELLGKHMKELLPERLHTVFDEKFRELKEKGSVEAEWEIIKKDGGIINVLVKAIAIYDSNGRFLKTSSIMHDVTELRRLEQEKEQLREQFIQAQKMEVIGNLSAGIAHDFNNMLMGIMGFVEMAMNNARSDMVRKYLQRALEITERASELTRQILIIGRKAPTERKLINVNDFISSFFKTVRRMVEENIHIYTELSDRELFIEADQGQLYQVLLNLVINARDAIGETGGIIHIKTDSAERCCEGSGTSVHALECKGDKFVKIVVSDNGRGIPDEIKERIFEPFFTTKEQGSGTGLGLPVVYSVVQGHGGCIEIISKPGEGTEFVLYFPSASVFHKTVQKEEADLDEARVDGTGLRVLAVDDEEIMRDFLHSCLSNMGFEVILAENGPEALDRFLEKPDSYHFVIIDSVIPGISGMELLRQMRRIRPGLKAIISTGYAPTEDLEEIKRSPDTEMIFKPFKINELVRIIRKILFMKDEGDTEG